MTWLCCRKHYVLLLSKRTPNSETSSNLHISLIDQMKSFRNVHILCFITDFVREIHEIKLIPGIRLIFLKFSFFDLHNDELYVVIRVGKM